MSEAPPDILFPILVAQLATERHLVDSFADRLRALSRDMSAIDADTSSAGALADLLFEAIAALEDHACEEEAFMKKLAIGCGPVSQYESHIEDHASLAEAMNAIVEAYANDDALDCARRLSVVLTRWRHEHIERFDALLIDLPDPAP